MGKVPLHPGEYVIYLRKSRADMEKEARGAMETLGKHERRLTAFAEEQGYLVADIRRELVSGESIQDRHVFQGVMSEVAARRWTGVIVHEVDRLGRGDMMEAGWILSVLRFSGTLVVTPEKTYDPTDRNDLRLLQDKKISSNNELESTKYRFRDGKEQASIDGQHIASMAPFGYRKVVVDGMKTLEPSEWAPTVVEIFEEVAAGTALSSLSMRLIARGVPGKWCNRRIKILVQNPVYKGIIAWNRMVKRVEARDGLALVKRCVRNEKPIMRKGLHPALVSDELWEEANAMIGKNPKTKPAVKFHNPLAGLLRCAKCGRAMHMSRSKRNYVYYIHYKYSECSCARSRYSDVIDAVVAALEEITEDLAIQIDEPGHSGRREAEMADLKKILDSCARRIDRLMVLFEDDAIDIAEFRRRRKVVDAQIFQAQARLSELEAAPDEDPREKMATLRSLMSMLADEAVDPADRNIAAKKLIDRVLYAKEPGGELHLTVELR